MECTDILEACFPFGWKANFPPEGKITFPRRNLFVPHSGKVGEDRTFLCLSIEAMGCIFRGMGDKVWKKRSGYTEVVGAAAVLEGKEMG